MAYLDIETPEGVRRLFLEQDRLSIGRLSYNDVILPSAQISRQHAELRYINGQWWIADLQSTNGLHINGRRVQQHQLADGDRVLLAPEISIHFHDEAAGDASRAPAAAPSYMPQQPAVPPWGPRSPFADDEQPYFPGMGFVAPQPPAFPGRQPDPDRAPASPFPAQPPQRPTMPVPSAMAGFAGSSEDGYSAAAPPNIDAVLRDPFRRSRPSSGGQYPTSGPASTLLHVCQTCSQLTAPDAVYCQNCHHSIAHECPKCRLTLLPIHDRCPRCQTPNPASVRRAHRPAGA
jgi:predicted component of type VI protein secretion system